MNIELFLFEDESMESSTEPLDEEAIAIETAQQIVDESALHPQVSNLKKSAVMISPVKLKQSPIKITSMARSPTVKLTKSPARGIIPPKFTMPSDEAEQPSPESQPIIMVFSNNQPIEIDDSDEEDNIESQTSNKQHVSFGPVIQLDESKNQSLNSSASEDNFDNKIND